MKSFGQRKGIVPLTDVIQVNGMNDALRNSLWNSLDVTLWSSDRFLYTNYGLPGIDSFSAGLWFHYFKKPIDSRPRHSSDKLKEIRAYFSSMSPTSRRQTQSSFSCHALHLQTTSKRSCRRIYG